MFSESSLSLLTQGFKYERGPGLCERCVYFVFSGVVRCFTRQNVDGELTQAACLASNGRCQSHNLWHVMRMYVLCMLHDASVRCL